MSIGPAKPAAMLLALLSLFTLAPIHISAQPAAPRLYADTILTNGKIVTVDKRFSIAHAVAIRDGKFLAVGSNANIMIYAGPNTKRIDLKGKTVLPGLIDTHAHVVQAGNVGYTVSFAGASTVPEALERIKVWAAKTKPGEWIIGNGWHPPSQLKERRYLTRAEIDAVAPNNPVFLPTVGHFAMSNSMALDRAGITKTTPDPSGGIFDRDAAGELNGVLEESAIAAVSSKIPPPSTDQRLERMKSAMHYFNTFGLTSTVDGLSDPAQFRIFQRLWADHQMTLRISAMYVPVAGTTTSVEDWEKTFKSLGASTGFGDDWLRFAGMGEMNVDGGMTLKTAFLREPYPNEPNNHGFAVISAEKLNQLVAICNRYGWRVGLHAVGDAAVDRALDAYEYANKESSIVGKRFVIIHGSLIQADQLKRAAALGVRVDQQNVFMWDKAETVALYVGKERANRAVPTRLIIDTIGIANVGAGTDYSVNTLSPFINFYIMITRKDPNGTVFGADQAITRPEAIRLYTSSAAGFNFDENKKGSIEPGKLADLVVLSDDLLTVPAEKIKDINALTTIVGGKIVYQR